MAYTINAPSSNTTSVYGSTVCWLDSTHIISAWIPNGQNSLLACVGTVSGTTVTYAGSTTAPAGHIASIFAAPNLAMLDSTHFVLGWSDDANNNACVVIGSVSGTTITFGAVLSVGTTTSGSQVQIIGLSATSFAVNWVSAATVNRTAYCTVSGTTITNAGSANRTVTSGATPIHMASINSTTWVAGDVIGELFAYNWTGSVVNAGSIITVSTNQQGSLFNIDSSHVGLLWIDASAHVSINVIGVSSTTLTAGSTLAYTLATYAVVNQQLGAVLFSGSNYLIYTHDVTAGKSYAFPGVLSAGQITLSAPTSYTDGVSSGTGAGFGLDINGSKVVYGIDNQSTVIYDGIITTGGSSTNSNFLAFM